MNFIKIAFKSMRSPVFDGPVLLPSRCHALEGIPGSGAGRSGRSGGSAVEVGEGIGQFGAAREDGYFYNKQKEQLQKLKKNLEEQEKNLANPGQKKDK